MTTRTKNIIGAIAAFLLAILLGLTCNAQPITTAPGGEDCGCSGKPSRHLFSCYPDCDFTTIQSIEIPGSGNELTAIAPKPGYSMDVKFYFNTAGKIDSLTYLDAESINFNYNVCELYYFEGYSPIVRGFESMVIIDHRYGPHPSLFRIEK